MADTLAATIRTVMIWSRTQDQDIGATVNAQTDLQTYAITDGSGARQADLVYAAPRTIPANSLEEIDLRAITQTTLGVAVAYDFRQLRLIRIRNDATVAGRRLRVGVDPGRPSVVYAAEIGPGSEWFSVNHVNAWPVTDANRSLWIANPNAAAITYSLWLIGTNVAPT
jgi:hypothetical protein